MPRAVIFQPLIKDLASDKPDGYYHHHHHQQSSPQSPPSGTYHHHHHHRSSSSVLVTSLAQKLIGRLHNIRLRKTF